MSKRKQRRESGSTATVIVQAKSNAVIIGQKRMEVNFKETGP